jgi:hypothetical protein
MADNELDAMQPGELEELEPETAEEQRGRLRDRVSGILQRLASPFVWLWNRLVSAWRWLVRPN